MSAAICFNLDQSNILLSGNGLIQSFVQNSKILTSFKSKAVVDDCSAVAEIVEINCERVENIMEKSEYTGCQLFPHCFQKPSFTWL